MIEHTALEYRETQGGEPAAGADSNPPGGSGSSHAPLFPGSESESFRAQWQAIQGEFVDEPRHAVEKADQLVSSVIARLSEVFAAEREKMGGEWPKNADGSTEDLRQALRRYRAFFDRLLSM